MDLTIKYDYKKPSNRLLKNFVNEMKTFSKEELEGLVKCIESDENVTRISNNGKVCIYENKAIAVHLFANMLLRKYQ